MYPIGTGAAARRSRGPFYDDRARRGLLHDKETEEEQEEGSIFLPVSERLVLHHLNIFI